MNKFFIVIVIAIIAVGGYYLLGNTPESMGPVSQTPIAEEKVIIYTDAGYSPSPLKIKAGETVVFKNESSRAMWPASAMHPTHKDYPTTGGCIGSTFDACKGVQPGESWLFQFDIAGDWNYHNHLNPKDFGAIAVEQ